MTTLRMMVSILGNLTVVYSNADMDNGTVNPQVYPILYLIYLPLNNEWWVVAASCT